MHEDLIKEINEDKKMGLELSDTAYYNVDDGVTDEFVIPTVITDEAGNPISLVKPGDSVIFFNFRPDRAREITKAFCFTDEDIAAQPGDAEDTKCIKYLQQL